MVESADTSLTFMTMSYSQGLIYLTDSAVSLSNFTIFIFENGLNLLLLDNLAIDRFVLFCLRFHLFFFLRLFFKVFNYWILKSVFD